MNKKDPIYLVWEHESDIGSTPRLVGYMRSKKKAEKMRDGWDTRTKWTSLSIEEVGHL